MTPKNKQANTRWLASLAGLVIVILLLLLQRRTKESDWQVVKGIVQVAEVVPDHVVENRGAHVTWRADFPITYRADGREYKVSFDPGIRAESKEEVETALPKTLPVCTVRYDRQSPQVAIAECR